MKFFLASVIILSLGIGGYWLMASGRGVVEENTPTSNNEANEQPTAEVSLQNYTNEEWGIAFEYPLDWEIQEPAFYSAVSKLNLSVEPKIGRKYPETILINITPKDWIDNAIDKMEQDGIVFKSATVSGFDAIKFESNYEGLVQVDYLIPINNIYWINIAGKKEYEDVLNQVIESFEITPVEISP